MPKYKSYIIYTLVILIILILSITIKNVKKNLDNKSDQISFLKKNLKNKNEQLKNIHTKLLNKDVNIENIIFEEGINFKNKKKRTFKLDNLDYDLIEFVSNDLIFAKHPEASSSAYIDTYEGNIFLATATGQITYSKIKNLAKNEFKFTSIKSNIQEIIKYSEFYNSSAFGIKDILVRNNKIYVSYIKEHYKDCFSTSIIVGELNFSFIFFKDFYSPKNCIEKNSEFFNLHPKDKLIAHQSGGRMIIVDNSFIFSTGEYRYRTLAQETDNDFGKIISINLTDNSKKIISMGHRNPQGLYFSNDLNMLFSTEHGPSGGDEINVLDFNLNNDRIANYGWPIASYGRHYFDNNDDKDKRYELSPLKKSHLKNGFIEPIKYFDPSVGISQIIGVPKNFFNSDNNRYLVGTMGNAKKFKEGMISLFFFEFDKLKNKIVKSEFIPIKSRVRDIIYDKNENIVLLYLENSNALAVLKAK
tara:strand:- start:73 stop:1488 length:1416 start_codon:yes stop_codon:yes gene_type:complete